MVISDDEEEINAARSKLSLHGNIFTLKLLMLFLVRASQAACKKSIGKFLLYAEHPEIKEFDDIVLKYLDRRIKNITGSLSFSNKWKMCLFQVKHKQVSTDSRQEIDRKDLVKTIDSDYSLQKYFRSYLKILQKILNASS